MARTWQPYRPAVKAKTWNSHSITFFLCLIPLLSPVLLTLAMADLKLSAIFSAAVFMLPSRVRVIPRYLNLVTSSRGVASYVKVGCCKSNPAEEDHDFCFVIVQFEPFETCIVIEFDQLELQTFSRVWNESNVISITTVRDLNWIQGSGSTSLNSQEYVYVIVLKGVQQGTQRAALFQASVGCNLLRSFVAINEKV